MNGQADVALDPTRAFVQLTDPGVLARCIPGCERMEESEPGVYDTLVRAGIGAVKGRFEGRITMSEVVAPEGYRLAIDGKSTVGYVQGGASIRLEKAESGTLIVYDGEAKVSGLIASVGARLIDAATKKLVRQFFDRLASEVASSA